MGRAACSLEVAELCAQCTLGLTGSAPRLSGPLSTAERYSIAPSTEHPSGIWCTELLDFLRLSSSAVLCQALHLVSEETKAGNKNGALLNAAAGWSHEILAPSVRGFEAFLRTACQLHSLGALQPP